MSDKERPDNIIKYRSRLPMTFVRVIFALILIYLVVQTVVIMKRKPLEAFQVAAASTENISGTYTGIILRSEVTVQAETEGYADYMYPEGEHVANGEFCCLLDRNGNFSEKLHEIYYNQDILSAESKEKIRETVLRASSSYDPLHFETALNARTEVRSALLTGLLRDGGSELFGRLRDVSYQMLDAPESGFLLLYEDGFENKRPDQLTVSDFQNSEYYRMSRGTGDFVKAGSFLYKLASDNRFTLSFLLSPDDVVLYENRKNLTVRMYDGSELTGSFQMIDNREGQKLGVVTFQKYGANYLSDRLVSFRVLDRSVRGYRIPETSLTKKSFFVVSEEYITEGGSTGAKGVVLRTSEGLRFVRATVYTKQDPEEPSFIIGDGVAYIAGSELKSGSIIVSEHTDPVTGNRVTHDMTLSVMASCEGVYQINHGFCIFKPVVRLEHSLESSYVIISADSRYGIQAYDRILLNAEGVAENEIVFE